MSYEGPLNILDYCIDATQKSGVIAGTVGLDVPWAPAAADAISQGRDLYLPKGTYHIAEDHTLVNSGFTLHGNNSTLIKHGLNPLFRASAADPVLGGGNLASNATAGATSVTLNAGLASAFAPGDVVVLNDLGSIGVDISRHRAEFLTVQAVSGNVITFWTPVMYSYAAGTASGQYARIIKAPLLKGVGYKDLYIKGEIGLSSTEIQGASMEIFDNNWLLNPQFENIHIDGFVATGISLRNCLNARIANYYPTEGGSTTSGTADPVSTEGLPGAGYGVVEIGLNRGLIVDQMVATRIRHAYTTGSPAPAGNTPYGEPVGALIANSKHYEAKNAGFDTHEIGRYITFADCEVINGHFVGIQVRCPNVRIVNLRAVNMYGSAVWVRGNNQVAGGTGNAYAVDCQIEGLRAEKTNLGNGIGYFDTTNWQEKGALQDNASGTRVVGASFYRTGGPAIQAGGDRGYVWQSYQGIDAVDVCQLTASSKSIIDVQRIDTSSTLQISNVKSLSSDGKVTNLINVAPTVTGGSVHCDDVRGFGHSGSDLQDSSVFPAKVTQNAVLKQRTERGVGSPQYVEHYADSTANHVDSFSDKTNAKSLSINITTDTANSSPSTGECKFSVSTLGTRALDVSSTKFGVMGVIAQPKKTVSGSRGSNAALQSLLTALSGYGLINDTTT